MSKKKASGSTTQYRTRPGKRLGVKIFGGQKVRKGQIIVRQKGSKFHFGSGASGGRDRTIFALKDGQVIFKKRLRKKIICVV